MACSCDLNSGLVNKENKYVNSEEEVKLRMERKRNDEEEPMSAYERMIQKNREEKMAFLQSLKIDEAKAGFGESIKKKKVKSNFKRVKKPTAPPELRKSRRLRHMKCEDFVKPRRRHQKVQIPPEITFKKAFKSEGSYGSYKVDVAIQEELKPEATFTIYDKSVLGKMTLSESNIAQVTPARITALTWHPSPEQLIIAAGDTEGQLGIWKMESENTYVFKIHLANISNLQFNPYNQTQLISSSEDGILRCGDMVKHQFSEIYRCKPPSLGCPYFDVLSATTYLVSQSNGEVALVDKRTGSKSCEEKYKCHDCKIKTVNIHPTDKNFFISADSKGSIRLWDLRKLQSTPVANIAHYKCCVHSAFFSPVTGNSILVLSSNDSISIYDSKDLTSDIKVRVQMKHDTKTSVGTTLLRATWLPNSDETFVVGSKLNPYRIEVYDKNMFVYSLMMHENLQSVISPYAFHPTRPALAGGNFEGKVFVFV